MRALACFASLLAIAMAPQIVSAAAIGGRITGPTGIGVYPLDIDVRNSSTGVLLVTPGDTTTVSGDFSITVPAGKYDVTFVPTAASHLFRDTRNGVTVTTTTTINRSLALGRYVNGRVMDGTGAGVPNVNIDFHSPTTGAAAGNFQDDLTDAGGYFNALVDPGTWDVECIAPTLAHLVPGRFLAVPLSADQSVGTVVLQPGHIVTASVTDVGLFPIVSADLDAVPSTGGQTVWTPQDNTDDTGTATMVLPTGIYDFVATPPAGLPYATRSTRAVPVLGDLTLANFDLPPGVTFSAHCQTAAGVAIVDVDTDVDSLPLMRRLETPGDRSNSAGNVSITVAPWKYRVTFSPTVASRFLPVRLDSVQVSAATNLGNIVFTQGHWVSVTVVEQGSGAPIQGVNLDLVIATNNALAITPGDVTDGTGFARITTNTSLYRLRVRPPSAEWDEVVIEPFRTLADTALVVALPRHTAGVGAGSTASLALSSPWPNPARGGLRVSYTAATASEVTLEVWDVNGRRIATLARSTTPGAHSVTWNARSADGSRVRAGVYWMRLSDGAGALARRFAVLD